MRYLVWLFLIGTVLAGCSALKSSSTEKDVTTEHAPSINLNEIANTEDPDIANRLDTFRPKYNEQMGVKVAHVEEPINFEKPEGPLGNIVADALRFRAAGESRMFVHIGIIGQSSFKTSLREGTLTLGDVYEFMPYENHLVLLQLTGDQVQHLAAEIAQINGAPVSGMRFTIRDQKPTGLLVNSQVVDPKRTYWVATSSYLANGGDQFSSLWNPVERIDFNHLSVRELYADYFRNRRNIEPTTDGRIRQ